MKDYYRLLELPRYAKLAALKAAYRRLAVQYHPDKLGSLDPQAQAAGAARMVELNEAISVLSDPVRRSQYDQRLGDWATRKAGAGPTQRQSPRAAGEGALAVFSRLGSLKNATSQAVAEAAEKLRVALSGLLKALPLDWMERDIQGWEWALEANIAKGSLLVAYRHLPDVSLVSASGLEALLDGLLLERVRVPKLRAAIGLMSCQRIKNMGTVVRRFQSFVEERPRWLQSVFPMLVIYNWQLGRIVRLGRVPNDLEVERVLRLAISVG